MSTNVVATKRGGDSYSFCQVNSNNKHIFEIIPLPCHGVQKYIQCRLLENAPNRQIPQLLGRKCLYPDRGASCRRFFSLFRC